MQIIQMKNKKEKKFLNPIVEHKKSINPTSPLMLKRNSRADNAKHFYTAIFRKSYYRMETNSRYFANGHISSSTIISSLSTWLRI